MIVDRAPARGRGPVRGPALGLRRRRRRHVIANGVGRHTTVARRGDRERGRDRPATTAIEELIRHEETGIIQDHHELLEHLVSGTVSFSWYSYSWRKKKRHTDH